MTIEERLDKLEQELATAKRRSFWLAGFAAIAIMLFAVVFADGQPKTHPVLRTRMLVLEEEHGKTRAVLGRFGDQEEPGLRLYGKNGKISVELSLTGDGDPLLAMNDENGGTRVALSPVAEGTGLVMLDNNLKKRIVMGVANGEGCLELTNSQGETRPL